MAVNCARSRIFSENAAHCIESDHWLITATRTES